LLIWWYVLLKKKLIVLGRFPCSAWRSGAPSLPGAFFALPVPLPSFWSRHFHRAHP
jgi:hypothetical protein